MKSKITMKLTAFILLIVMVFPAASFAQGAIDVYHAVSLNVNCISDETPIAGADISIYQIATVNETEEFTVTEKFKPYEDVIDFSNMGENGDAIALALKGYVEKDGLEPLKTLATDANGSAAFSGSDMKTGIYLVIGASTIKDGLKYNITPFIVAVPERDNDNNAWNYDVTAYPKCNSEKAQENIDIAVLKIWMDEGYEKERPESITVDLLKDGEVYDSVLISEKDNWEYEWTDLDGTCEWNVVEKEIEGYTVAVGQSDEGFVITNSKGGSDNPGHGANTPGGNGTTGNKLPQTGQLWWPVPALLILGLAFLAAGLIRRNRSSER